MEFNRGAKLVFTLGNGDEGPGPGRPGVRGPGPGFREQDGQAGGCIYSGPVRMACSSLSAASAAGIYKKRAAWLEGAWARPGRP